ncbi:MBL fold metallo-hydrolase [Cohnella pontilimi]|uniref:MBL fold metallo-hydrolase n=1 Tax=Cohnella pontilimi TaxID=2564100 RepID=A0A4U0FGY4_9BACL|nr:MBL fold metallo-hydrolase [Cohnella pontilimi]TJY44215.1 MBL fold metallo-hydrolase [Cohnella pontilimi]
MQITFLGNGDSLGTPRVYCDCAVCSEARTTGANRRLRCSVWIELEGEKPLLLDCGPDWRGQMERIGIRAVDQALITHAHFDHIGGLTEWADACRWREVTADLYAPMEVLEEISQRFPWVSSRLQLKSNDEGMNYGDWRIDPWKVNHGKNGFSYAYRFEHVLDGRTWAYCSDSIQLTEEQKAPLYGVNLLVLGTSFAEEPYPMETRSVYDLKEGIRLAEEVRAENVLFTHLSHDIDVRRDYGLPAHMRLAQAGMKITV